MKTRILMLLAATLAVVLLAGAAGQSAQAQTAVWRSEFFDNPYLTEEVVLELTTNEVAFNWGDGSPGPEVPADNFSARISTDIFFPAGTYRFWILANDGVTFYFDFQPYIDTFEADETRPGELLQVDITVPSGVYHIQLDYREFDLAAFIYFDYANLNTNPTGPDFPVPVEPTPIPGGQWTAQYYANATLSGAPSLVLTDNGPNVNWGVNAPAPSLPADNFSIRWTSQQFFDGSTYEIRTRADDGVRVYIDGILYIDEFTVAQNRVFTRQVVLAPGFHTLTVEYYEATGLAFVEFALTRLGTVAPTPAPPTGFEATATVTAFRLNVRDLPSATGSRVITQISVGQTFPVTGRLVDGSWFRINVNGVTGWVSAAFVNTANVGAVPIVTPGVGEVLSPTGFTLTTTANLNIRTDDSLSADRLGVIPRGTGVPILARNAATTWFFVRYEGLDGWVSADFVTLGTGTDLGRIPVR